MFAFQHICELHGGCLLCVMCVSVCVCVCIFGDAQCKLFIIVSMQFGLGLLNPLLLDLNCGSDWLTPCVLPSLHFSPPTHLSVIILFTLVSSLYSTSYDSLVLCFSSLSVLHTCWNGFWQFQFFLKQGHKHWYQYYCKTLLSLTTFISTVSCTCEVKHKTALLIYAAHVKT